MRIIPDFAAILKRYGGSILPGDAEVLYASAIEIQAKRLFEIGSREGGSSMVLGMVAKETGGSLTCIEPVVLEKWYRNIRALGLMDYVHMIEASSPWVPGLFHATDGIDYLFLDGGGPPGQPHHTRWMLTDYHYWEPLVRGGGRIAFHDWTGGGVGRAHVRRAISIILETDNLKEVNRYESTAGGTIVFEKEA